MSTWTTIYLAVALLGIMLSLAQGGDVLVALLSGLVWVTIVAMGRGVWGFARRLTRGSRS